MAGESVAALVVSINRIITKASTSSERFGANAFFLISILFVVICVCCQQFIRASPFVKYHVRQCRLSSGAAREGEEGVEEIRLKSVDGGSEEGGNDRAMLLTSQRKQLSLFTKFRGE